MLRKNVVKGALGLSAAAALFAVFAVQAQSTGNGTGSQTGAQTTSGQQSGSTGSTGGATGGTGNSSTSATGVSGTSGSSQAGTSTTSAAGQAGATGSGNAASGTLSKSDQKMIMGLAQANMAEIEAGRLAQTKSQNDEVKKFAQQMIDDHSKALDEVKQLAQNKGVTMPTDLDRTHRAMASKLSALSGEKFDRAYLAQAGVADHKKNHAMLQQAQSRAKDPELKALVARIQPVVDQHLSTVQQLHKNTAVGSSKSRGDTGSSSDKSGNKNQDNSGATPDKK